MTNVLDMLDVETFQQKLNEQLKSVLKWPGQKAGGPSQNPILKSAEFLTKAERREFGEENETYRYIRKSYIANLKEYNAGRTSSFVLLFTTYGAVQMLEYQRAILLGKFGDVLEMLDEEDDPDEPFEDDEFEEEEEVTPPLAESTEPEQGEWDDDSLEDGLDEGEEEIDDSELLPPIKPRESTATTVKPKTGSKTKKRKPGSKIKKKKAVK